MTFETDVAPATPSGATTASSTPARWLVVLGAVQVVVGGLVAAATGPLGLERGSWLAAYLVLVGGVAQYVIGRSPSWFGHRLGGRLGWSHVVGWNAGNLAVITGVFAATPYVVDAGGVVLLVVLVIAAHVVIRRPVVTGQSAAPRGRPVARATYVGVLVVLAVSIPIGLTLAHLRA